MKTSPAIAVVGLACRYPGAATLREFWENIVSRRRQFRRMPAERLPLDDYFSADPTTPDKTYGTEAAVIDGFDFDWIGRGIPKPMFQSADIVHWLALEVALSALEDAGYPMAEELHKERAGIILGNTLTGEHTRATTMRLRWPFIEKAMRAAAQAKGLSAEMTDELAATTGQYFKSVFAPTTEDTLAGGLSNTIAGRICGYLGLEGGGYTVDGACSSSLIAVATAATALANGTLNVALAGGVDVSLDTFELIGFAKTGALTKDDMRVYDRRANGFKPGEGCGFVVLKRLEDAMADGDYIYSVLRGWGIASDGKRAVTAPNAQGQARAICRAYEQADYSPRDLDFVEGHGTGTKLGDAVELEGIGLAVESDGEAPARSVGVTSLKSVIGHTKAAAGVGGFIKAVIAANRRVLPPTAGCTEPSDVFDGPAKPLYPILDGQVRPASDKLRVGVTAAGFGGINCHVTLESGDAPAEHLAPQTDERALFVSAQQSELFVAAAASVEELIERIDAVRALAEGISHAELVDLAAKLADEIDASQQVRAAVVAGTPSELLEKLDELRGMLVERAPQDSEIITSPDHSIWIGNRVDRARVAMMFPGQGSQRLNMARTLVERYEWARELVDRAAEWLRPFGLEGIKDLLYRPTHRAVDADEQDAWNDALRQTEVAQPAICLASLLWKRHLELLGIEPVAVGGHSLGELSAFQAAGAFDEKTLLCLAAARGKAMSASSDQAGAMASLGCTAETAAELVIGLGDDAVVANINSPMQTVVSGEPSAIAEVVRRAEAENIRTTMLPVSNAFHSKFVAEAADQLRAKADVPATLAPVDAELFSSTDGSVVAPQTRLADHFADQITSQVDFVSLVEAMSDRCDLFVEVGPGRVLSSLIGTICGADGPLCLPSESKPSRDQDLNTLVGCFFVRGGTVNFDVLYDRRLVREFVAAADRLFIDNPCERPMTLDGIEAPATSVGGGALETTLARETGLPQQTIADYLARRGSFLGAVVRADLESSNGQVSVAQPQPAPVAAEAPQAVAEVQNEAADTSISQMLLEAVEQVTGFPPESVSMDMHLIDDMNLDSIKAAELVASVAKRLDIAGDIDPSQFGNATLGDIAAALGELAAPAEASPAAKPAAKAAAKTAAKTEPSWVRNFVVDYLEEQPHVEARQGVSFDDDNVLVLSEAGEDDVADALRDQLSSYGAKVDCAEFEAMPSEGPVDGQYTRLVAILPRGPRTEDSAERLTQMIHRLRSVVAAPRSAEPTTVAFVQFGGGEFGRSCPTADVEQLGAKALAASLHLERDDLKVRCLDFAAETDPAALATKVALELTTPEKFAAVGYDAGLMRRVPRMRLSQPAEYAAREITWSADDVVLVTGGAKGITAECALAVAEQTGVRMALVGSSAGTQSKIEETLKRFADKGLTARYFQCDVADAEAVETLIADVESELGPVTGVVHGAAVNKPRQLADVNTQEAFDEVAPKVLGIVNLCQALDAKPPKLLAGLTSIIGISGMWRNGWYGFSNEVMDQILGQFNAKHPETAVVATAYSVWDEVGMGFRMGATDFLASKGIGSIPAAEGVRRFVELFLNDPQDRQVAITARMAGLESILQPAEIPSIPKAQRYLEDIKYIYPGVELVSRVHLDAERDSYLKDHVWKGSLLMPTVFGLEAMSQAAAYVTGREEFDNVRIDNIQLPRPIVVDPENGLDVQIRAEVIERTDADAPLRVKVGISTETSDFTRDHFAAEFVLVDADEPATVAVELPEQPLDIEPKRDLYGDLLFQGESFQRIEQIHALDSSRCIFSSKIDDAADSLLGDAYFRDSLLQSVQLLVPQKLALPVGIKSFRRYRLDDCPTGKLTAVAMYEGEEDRKQTFTVVAVDEAGRVVERLDGYVLGIIEDKPENPTAEELAAPSRRDEQIVRDRLDLAAEAFEVEVPEVVVAHMPALHELSKDERHVKELPLMVKVAEAAMIEGEPQIAWLDSGKPVVEGAGAEELGISLSHDDHTLLCTSGRCPQGCDLEPVRTRSREDWIALLGKARTALLDELIAGGDTLDQAGTRLWNVVEAARKATAAVEIDLRIRRRSDENVLFDAEAAEHLSVLSCPMKLTYGGEKFVAVVAGADKVAETQPAEAIARPAPTTADDPSDALLAELGFEKDHHGIELRIGERGQRVMFTRSPLTFRDNRMLGGGIYFSNYYAWMGKIRELAISPLLDRLAGDMSGGEWGMVTNNAKVQVLGDVVGSGVIETRAWMESLTGRDNSTMELRFEWYKVGRDGRCEQIARGSMQITWVRVIGHGMVEIAPLPKYVQEYIASVAPTTELPADDEMPADATFELGEETFCPSRGPRAGRVLNQQTFQTSLEDANLVGNIYFDNYSKWQGRLRDLFFFETAPQLYRAGAPEGELMCRAGRVQHIREAMPFDKIEVTMGLRAVFEHGVKLEFEYSRVNPDGTRDKLAFAEHDAVWVVRDAEGEPVAAPLPGVLKEALCNSSDRLQAQPR